MKILSFLLSTALVASSFGTAAAGNGNGVGHGPVDQSPVGWTRLASILTSGSSAGFATDARAVDGLMLQLERGTASVASVTVTFDDGSSYVATVGAKLGNGVPLSLDVPSAGRHMVGVQLGFEKDARSLIYVSAR